MIISKTPYRISFFGGGTDYPQWYQKEGGAVLSTTIDKYCYISCRYLPPFFDIKHRIVWSHIETTNTISEILHPAVREGLRVMGFTDNVGMEIHHQGDLPARTGIGSSSSFMVGLIKALSILKNQKLSKLQLAQKAIDIEQNVLKENVGCQDQVAAAFGGLNVIEFMKNGDLKVNPVKLKESRLKELESNLLMIYSGKNRLASDVASSVISNMSNKSDSLHQMRLMVDRGIDILDSEKSLDAFGELLHQGWLLKKELSPRVSNSHLDSIYKTACDNGAVGGKLLGAGGGGFMVFYVPSQKRKAVTDSLASYLHVPLAFDNSGSTVIYESQDIVNESRLPKSDFTIL